VCVCVRERVLDQSNQKSVMNHSIKPIPNTFLFLEKNSFFWILLRMYVSCVCMSCIHEMVSLCKPLLSCFEISLACWTNTHMGWLRLVGSLKLKDSFAKEPYKKDYILQTRPILLRGLPIVATT